MPKQGKQSGNKGRETTPYTKGSGSRSAGAPPAAPAQQWRLSGGGTRAKAPPPAKGTDPAAGAETDAPCVWGKDERAFWVVSTNAAGASGWDEDMDDDGKTFSMWNAMGLSLRHKEVLGAYFFKHLQACESRNELDLHRAVLKVLSEGSPPRIEYDSGYDGLVDVWHRKDESVMLDEARGTHLRYQGVDAVIFGSATAFWPPPVELVVQGTTAGRDASVSWEIKWKAPPTVEQLQAVLLKAIGEGWTKAFFFRKADAEGRPTHTWFLKGLNVDSGRKDLKLLLNAAGIEGTAVLKYQCALCLERPAAGVSHDHIQCPLIGTLNKVRAQGNFKPLFFGSGGGLVREDEQIALDLDKEVRLLKDLVAALSQRVGGLESAAGKASHKGGPAKGRTDVDAGGGGAKGGKGGKGGAGKKGGGGQEDSGRVGQKGQGEGSGSGKGKAKAK